MSDKTIEFQAKIYIYDLQNCAREFGFRADERWEVCIASAPEKTALERKYFPTLSAKLPPDMLTATLGLIKSRLSQQLAEAESNMEPRDILQQELQYLVAYNAKRFRN